MRPFGGRVGQREALQIAAGFLTPPYEIAGSGTGHVELRGPELPSVTLRLAKERRMFSRTFALVVEASSPAMTSSPPTSVRLRRTGLRRQPSLAGTSSDAGWGRLLEEAGMLHGVDTMTNVISLEARRDGGEAGLRLATLAGSLIGTAPGSWVAVPMEPEDVRGLLQILRALSVAAASAGV